MSDAAMICTVITVTIELLLMAFAIFCIGFFVGYRREDCKIMRKNQIHSEPDLNKKQENSEKQWKNFLNYDGSANSDNNDI